MEQTDYYRMKPRSSAADDERFASILFVTRAYLDQVTRDLAR
jgi:hypothetical protein